MCDKSPGARDHDSGFIHQRDFSQERMVVFQTDARAATSNKTYTNIT